MEIWYCSFDVEKILEGRKLKNLYNMNTFTSFFQNKYKMRGVSPENIKRERLKTQYIGENNHLL